MTPNTPEQLPRDLDRNISDQMADAHGIDPMRPTPDGPPVEISQETKAKLLRALDVKTSTGPTSRRDAMDLRRTASETVAACFIPDFLSTERVWGISLQLYELRSERNSGIGDFEDLRVMIDLVVSRGGDFIGLNPYMLRF